MQATQPLRTFQPLKAGIAAFVAVAILVAAIVATSLVSSLGRSAGAGSNAGTDVFVPVRHDFYVAPGRAPLPLDPDSRDAARDGGHGIRAVPD